MAKSFFKKTKLFSRIFKPRSEVGAGGHYMFPNGEDLLSSLRSQKESLFKKQSETEREINKAVRQKAREANQYEHLQKSLEQKIKFVENGGTKVSLHVFDGPDRSLRKKFSWYRNWHLNPISLKTHWSVATTYSIMAVLFLFMVISMMPKISSADLTTSPKTSRVASISAESTKQLINTTKTLPASDKPLLSIYKDNLAVDFSDKTSRDASASIRTTNKQGDEQSFSFTLMQPRTEDVSPVSQKESNIAHAADESVGPNIAASKEDLAIAKTDSVQKSPDNPDKVDLKVNNNLSAEYQIKSELYSAEVKETVIIENKSALTSDPDYQLRFEIDLKGLKVAANGNGGYTLSELASNLEVMKIAAPIIEDAGKIAATVTLEIVDNQAIYTIDKNFVDTATFPLYLDPTVTIATSTITNPNSYSKDRTLFEATNGDMVSIYSAGTEVDYKISSDKGNTWGSATKIIDSSVADDNGFSGWITADNKIHFTYSDNNTNSYIFYRQMTYDTTTHTITSMGTERTVESAGTSQAFPTVVQKSDATIFVAYRYYDASDYTIRVKASTDAGATWSASTTLSAATNASAAIYPALTIWNSNPAVIYNFANASLRWNYYTGSAWQAAGWANESITTEVDADTGLEFSISQQTSDYNLHLAWRGSGTNGIRYVKNANAAAGWDAASTAITSAHNDRNPSIGLGLSDAIYLYYSEYIGANSYNIKFKQKTGSGGTFSAAVAVTSDNANNLIAQSGLKPTDITVTSPASGYDLSFNGTSAYLSVPSGFADFSGGLSFSVWAYPTSVKNYARFFDFSESGSANDNVLFYRVASTNDLGYATYNGATSSTAVTATGAITLNTWQHFVVTQSSAGAVTIYKNGAVVAGPTTIGLPTNVTRTTNYIGKSNWADDLFAGKLDEPQMYNRALSTTEVAALYNSGVVSQSYFSSGLVAGWHFEENTGTTSADYSGNSKTATFQGSTTPSWAAQTIGGTGSVIAHNNGVNAYSPVVFVAGAGSPYSLKYAPTVKIWSAAADGNWETAGNWTPSGAPAAGDIIVFDATSIKNCTVTTFTSGNGIVDGLGGLYMNTGYSGTINFQKKPSQNADPFKINITGDFQVNSGTVTTEGDVTVAHDGVTDGRGNEFVALNMRIAAGASFNADGKGFTAANGPGYTTNGSGSYGGEGGGAAATKAYGDYSNPVSLGSGSSSYNTYSGGGAIILNVTNTLDIMGTVSANGLGSDTYGYNGASGGTVNLHATTISNSGGGGTVTSNGGNGYSNLSSGSGGRIKLDGTTLSYNGTLTASGGTTGNVGSAGTIYKLAVGQSNGDLIITNGANTPAIYNQVAAHLKTSTDNGGYQFDSITFSNYGRLVIDVGQSLNIATATVTGDKNSGFINAGTMVTPGPWTIGYMFSDKNGTVTGLSTKAIIISSAGRLTHYQNPDGASEVYKLNWSVSNLIVQASGEINADGIGFTPGDGPGYTTNGSGSYGGEGGGAAATKAYGDYSNPVSLGSGSNSQSGGGAIILNVTNTLDIMGTVSANGLGSTVYGNNGASGGTVNLHATTISNSGGGGTVTSNGGAGYSSLNGGSGGRIKLDGTTLSYGGSLVAAGGAAGTSGSAGTIYKLAVGQSNGDLIITNGANTPAIYNQVAAHLKTSTDNGGYQFDSITFSNYGRLVIDVGQSLNIATATVTGDKNSGFINAGTVTVPNDWTMNCLYSSKGGAINGWTEGNRHLTLTSTALATNYTNTDTKTYYIDWQMDSLEIQAHGEINTLGYSANNGPGAGVPAGCCGGSGGGGHGGQGGPAGSAGGGAYDSVNDPTDMGSGGGNTDGGSYGGGYIKLNITNGLKLDGSITATGENSVGDYSGAGAGGTVSISTGSVLLSSGTISADGGGARWRGGGGGGGRVAITYTSDTTGSLATINPTAKGGINGIGWTDNLSRHGAAGTVYIRKTTETNGSLKIDNGASTTTTAVTPLTLPLAYKSVTVSTYGTTTIATNADPAQNTFAIDNDLTVDATSQMNLFADKDGTPASGAWPIITVGGNAAISGILTSTGNGYIHDAGAGKGIIGSSQGSGAGYGGIGGNSANGTLGGPAYGTQSNNNYIGSGGGNTLGGSGGGMIKMTVVGNLALSTTGAITTNGSAGGAAGGGGSGGSIQISVNGTLTGSGAATVTANGGAGGSNGGGGGGGRIALYTAGDTFTGTKTATGGAAGTGGATAGSNGSVFAQHSPASLTMNAPNDTASDQIQKTVFRFNSTDIDGDWIQYKIQLATDTGFTQNISTFDETVSQNPTNGGRTALFSNQDKTTGGGAGSDGYSSGREAVLTMQTNLTAGTTYYWRLYAYDPEGVDSFDGNQHWSAVSSTRSFTVSAINHISFSTAAQNTVVTFCSAIMTINLRDTSNNNMYLTSTDGAKVFNLTTTSASGGFYSDGSCQNAISGNNLNIGVDENSASFYYSDTTPSPIGDYWDITAAETPSAGWTDATQQIRVRPGDFGSLEISIGSSLTQVTAGIAFSTPANDVTVTAKDIFGNVKNDWTGQVWFYSSDSQAVFTYNDGNRYAFTSGDGLDNGSHVFVGSGFTYKTKGSQSLVVHNSVDAQYDALTNITVLCAPADHFSLSSYPRAASNKFAMSSFTWDTPGYSSAPYSPIVGVYDAYSNLIDNFTGEVWFELYESGNTPGNPLDSSADYTFDNDYTNHYTFTTGDRLDNGSHLFDGAGFNVVTAANDLRFRVKTSSNGGKVSDFTIIVKPQAIDHFTVTASPTVSRNGTNWETGVDSAWTQDVVITAYDDFGNVKTDYAYDESSKAGLIYFYSSDQYATLPYYKTSSSDSTHCAEFPAASPGVYTLTPSDFPSNYFKMNSGSPQTLSASECIDPTSSYATDPTTNKYDPRLESSNPLKNVAAVGVYPAVSNDPNKFYVANHVPGSTHTATDHSNDSNDLIEAGPGHQQVTLSWANPFDIPTDQALDPQVYIYRCSANCDQDINYSKIVTSPTTISVTPSSLSEYTDTGLTNGNTYFYKLSYAYLKQDDSYMESNRSIAVNATPADIAPRDVTATQLDITDGSNPGKVKIEFKLRWDSTVSLGYYNPSNNSWHNATTPAMSGDVGAGVTGDVSLIQHTAYLDPNIDFDGQYLNGTFKIRVRVTVGASQTYVDSSTFTLDSNNPASASMIMDATSGDNANLTFAATDNNTLTMKVSTNADFSGASWQSFTTSINGFDLNGKTIVYAIIRDTYNNSVDLQEEVKGIPQNVNIKDGSSISSNTYRLLVIWDDVSPSPAHYNLYRSLDGENFIAYDVTTKNAAVDINLDPDTTYSYKVQSEDASGNKSPLSDAVSSQPGTAPDVTAPPQVELFGWKQDIGVRAKITWTTDQNSDSFVAYSTEQLAEGNTLETVSGRSDNVMVVGQPELVSDHEITLNNLNPSTKYYFKVLSKNEIQITGYSTVFDFTTPERILLLISGLKITDITNVSAFASWTTSKLSTTVLEYGNTTAYGNVINDENMNTDHKFQLKDLLSGDYHLRVRATDADGNVTISDDYLFNIPPTPTISNVVIDSIGDNTAKVSWTTNVLANSNVDITSEKNSGSQGNGDLTTTHSVTLVGLEAKTVYSFKIRSIDSFGNTALSDSFSFTTTADLEAPKIIEPKSEITSTGSGDNIRYQLIVSWQTDEPATSKVEYGNGVGNSYESSSKEDISLNMTHTVIVTDLKPNSVYHFRIKSGDKSNNIAYSEDYTVTTPPKEKNILTIILNAIVGPLNDIYQGVMNKLLKR